MIIRSSFHSYIWRWSISVTKNLIQLTRIEWFKSIRSDSKSVPNGGVISITFSIILKVDYLWLWKIFKFLRKLSGRFCASEQEKGAAEHSQSYFLQWRMSLELEWLVLENLLKQIDSKDIRSGLALFFISPIKYGGGLTNLFELSGKEAS